MARYVITGTTYTFPLTLQPGYKYRLVQFSVKIVGTATATTTFVLQKSDPNSPMVLASYSTPTTSPYTTTGNLDAANLSANADSAGELNGLEFDSTAPPSLGGTNSSSVSWKMILEEYIA